MKIKAPVLALAAIVSGHSAFAQNVELPSQMTVTAYGTSSAGYAQILAIGNTLREDFGTSIRIIPGKNDVSRMIPLRDGIADYCGCSIAAYFAQEGASVFAARDWGPQRVYNIFNNAGGDNGLTMLWADDAGINTWADLKGKRVGTVVAAPAVEYNTTGFLAFAGLTWDDVERVEFTGYKQMISGLISGRVDAVFGNTIGSYPEQIAASPHGLKYPTFPHDDEAAWDRFREIAPYFNKRIVSQGVKLENNVTGKVPFEGAGFPYPIYVTYGDKTADEVYAFTKAVFESYEKYKTAAPASVGYQVDRQALKWVMPYHAGSIRYFKEAGAWGAEEESHNEMLLKRQDLLASAWEEFLAKDVNEDGFADAWMTFRAEKLTEADMPVVFLSAQN